MFGGRQESAGGDGNMIEGVKGVWRVESKIKEASTNLQTGMKYKAMNGDIREQSSTGRHTPVLDISMAIRLKKLKLKCTTVKFYY